MKRLTLLLAAFSLFFFSCSNHNHGDAQTNGHSETENHEGHGHDAESESLKLNEGEKWKVNAEMLPAIQSMENDISSFESAGSKDYNALAGGLQKNIGLLTKSCTMTGQGHEELHKWLLPLIAEVKALSEADDEKVAAEKFQKIKASFEDYHQYFQ